MQDNQVSQVITYYGPEGDGEVCQGWCVENIVYISTSLKMTDAFRVKL